MTDMFHFSTDRRLGNFLECSAEDVQGCLIRHTSGVKESSDRKQQRRCALRVYRSHSFLRSICHRLNPFEFT